MFPQPCFSLIKKKMLLQSWRCCGCTSSHMKPLSLSAPQRLLSVWSLNNHMWLCPRGLLAALSVDYDKHLSCFYSWLCPYWTSLPSTAFQMYDIVWHLFHSSIHENQASIFSLIQLTNRQQTKTNKQTNRRPNLLDRANNRVLIVDEKEYSFHSRTVCIYFLGLKTTVTCTYNETISGNCSCSPNAL